ncbi:DUF2087 domain-containing protein [Enterococcus alcedinis]|uniref:Transcriptional regulator n=1 Tax=Enterococcus alcedinis TaxID=1274384 RepID=A0A917JGU9_9ENTE|nr:DUF2087 domain-containing protein [Enterococcus alcedinis]MBP2102993.1 hypothetical protein [Enterococcus alcedinis]GGI66534.1 transcriptional regulator [Enterococcus alcedinis]
MKYEYTEKEKENVLANFMRNDKIINVPAKEKKKYILLDEFIKRFERDKKYTEIEINEALMSFYPAGEHVEQRRYLVTFGFFERTSDGSQYRLSETTVKTK